MKTKTTNLLLITALVPLFFLLSCDKVNEIAHVDVKYTIPTITFMYTPPTFKGGDDTLYKGWVSINADSIKKAYDIPNVELSKLAVEKVTISILSPSEADFGWLQSCNVYISSDTSFSSPLEIGQINNNGSNAKIVILLDGQESIEMRNSGFGMEIHVNLFQPPPNTWNMQMSINAELKLTF